MPTIDDIKKRLRRYPAIRLETDNMLARLEMLKSEEEIPPLRPGDGSKRTAGTGDRQERAILRRMEYEERTAPTITANKLEIKAIDKAVAALSDPLEREVITIRYIEADSYKPLKCREVAVALYGDDAEADILRVSRLHKKALESLQEIMQEEGEV